MGESERRAYAEPTRGLIRLDNISACNRQARGVADGRDGKVREKKSTKNAISKYTARIRTTLPPVKK